MTWKNYLFIEYEGDCSRNISCCQECDDYVLEYRDIKDQSTAYDIDKVVEQLEREGDKIPIQYEYNYEKGVADGLCRASDIVKEYKGE